MELAYTCNDLITLESLDDVELYHSRESLVSKFKSMESFLMN